MDFLYTVNAESDEPIMLLNQHIGFDEEDGQGINGSSFQSELLYLDTLEKKRIQVWINSTGGSVIEGYSIYNAILKSKTPVDTYCVGIGASIAGVIFQAGRKRVMADYAILMYHNAHSASDKVLSVINKSLVTMVASRSGISEVDVENIMNAETFINAETAVKMGFADSIEKSTVANTKYAPKKENEVRAFYKECNLVLNSLKKTDMIEVKNRLKLAENATEKDVLNAIELIENKVSDLEVKNKSNEEKVVELQCEIEDKTKELETLKNELEAEKLAKDKAELDASTQLATSLVENEIEAGKIENTEDVKNKWIALAVKDLQGTKDLLNSIPLNKKAIKIEDKGNVAPYNMASTMAQINNKQLNK